MSRSALFCEASDTGPWVLFCDSIDDVSNCTDGFLRIDIRDDASDSVSDILNAFSKALDFPDYFSGNFNSLYDCLTDLAWLPRNGYLVVVRNSGRFLSSESEAEVTGLLDLLGDVGREWSRPVEKDVEWKRKTVPFYVLVEVPSDLHGMHTKFLRSYLDEAAI